MVKPVLEDLNYRPTQPVQGCNCRLRDLHAFARVLTCDRLRVMDIDESDLQQLFETWYRFRGLLPLWAI